MFAATPSPLATESAFGTMRDGSNEVAYSSKVDVNSSGQSPNLVRQFATATT